MNIAGAMYARVIDMYEIALCGFLSQTTWKGGEDWVKAVLFTGYVPLIGMNKDAH
jgi:hypothetical protein